MHWETARGEQSRWAQSSEAAIWSAMYSACRMANATIVSVGLAAAPVVNWDPVSYTHLTLPTNREV